MKNYKLTSPMMHGDEVKTLQKRLAGNNKFKENYRPGKIDGKFGESTAAAAYRAKFALGFLRKDLRRTYGPYLDNLLTGKAKLPQAYQKRRTQRKKAAKAMPIGVKALNEAKKHIGVKENPRGSNRCQFSVWYGFIGPWCAMFATYCFDTQGSKAFVRGSRFSYVPYIIAAARAGGQGMYVTNNPKPGDLVCYDWDRNGNYDHVGIFEKWTGGGNWSAIEGNTGADSYSNGGMVMRATRNRGMANVTFIRVVK